MNKQFDIKETTDLGTFLGRIAHRLNKEGSSLQALADKWFDEGDSRNMIRQFGIDITALGEQLLILRNQLCKNCMLKSVVVTINFVSDSPSSKEQEVDEN